MQVIQSILLFLSALSILVILHELGHFWAARLFGMKVHEFALFFGPKIFSFQWGDTLWRINSIPFGGYVQIAGMMDENMDAAQETKDPEPTDFLSKPRWQRLIVMLGGIIMNVILGIILFTCIKFFYGDTLVPLENVKHGIYVAPNSSLEKHGFKTGDNITHFKGKEIEFLDEIANPQTLVERNKTYTVERNGQVLTLILPNDFLNTFMNEPQELPMVFAPDMKPEIDAVEKLVRKNEKTGTFDTLTGLPAFTSGLRKGDLITAFDSVPVTLWSEVKPYISSHKNMPVVIHVSRKGTPMEFTVTPDSAGKIGIELVPDSTLETHFDYSFGEALSKGPAAGLQTLRRQVLGLVMMATGNLDVRKNVGGPIRMVSFYDQSVKNAGSRGYWQLTAVISMVLAIMNLLPIPGLDGGHVLFLLIEMVIRRDLPTKFKLWALRIGFFFIISLMLLIIFNDIINLF